MNGERPGNNKVAAAGTGVRQQQGRLRLPEDRTTWEERNRRSKTNYQRGDLDACEAGRQDSGCGKTILTFGQAGSP